MLARVAAAQQTVPHRTTLDTELGGFFISQTDGSPWSAYGAFVGVASAYSASFFDPLAIKANYTRFHVFKPSDDTDWNYFPYTSLRSYEAREVAAGRPPIFITATYQGKKRPVLWAWSLALSNGVPTTPQQNWQYAVNVGDDRFIRFWVNQYLRPMMWNDMYDVPNLWWGVDESAFSYELYGVLDDNNRFVAGVPWDSPFPQNASAYAASIATFFTRLEALTPDVRTLPNLGTMDDPGKFQTIFADAPGLVQEGFYEPNPSGYSRNAWLPYFDGVSWFGAQGRIAVLRAVLSRTDRVTDAYAMYQLVKGPNFFFAPMYDDNGAAVPRSQYARMEADLGAPLSAYESVLEPGMWGGYRLFWRMYEGGVVYMNWTGKTRTVTLPADRQYYDTTGRLVTQITMADATSAYVSTTPLEKAARPLISPRMAMPAAGPVTVSMVSTAPGAAIYYTINGSTPTALSTRYTGPLTLYSSATVKAIAIASSYAGSTVSTAAYTITGTGQVNFAVTSDSGPSGTAYPVLSLDALPTQPVTVDYSVTQPNGSVTNGSVRFLQGEQYRYFPVAASGADNSTVRVTITGAVNARLGAQAQYSYTINPPSGGGNSGSGEADGQTSTVTQPNGCTFVLGATASLAPAAGVTATVAINASAPNCTWTASSDKTWAQVYPLSGTGTATLSYTVYPNYGTNARTAALSVSGRTLVVTQAAALGTPDQRFVGEMYFAAFGRVASPAEIAGQIAGGLSRPDLVNAFMNVPEFHMAAKFAAGLYVGILGRDAEYSGWLFQRNAMAQQGITQFVLVENFLNSAEFNMKNPNLTDANFVRLLYRQVLGREGSQPEVEFQVANMKSRVSLAVAFLMSNEYKIRVGPRLGGFLLHALLLQRDPTDAELDARAAQITAGVPLTTIIGQMLPAQ
jgi:hypothetical protein